MSVQMNVVVHCDEDNHDKVYMGCIKKQAGSYQVIGKWGRVGRTLSSQLKGSSAQLAGAVVMRDNVIQEKIAKGYRNIQSLDYHGSVTLKTPCVAENLELEIFGTPLSQAVEENLVRSQKPTKSLAESRNPISQQDKEFVVVCRDNTGIEERFDENIEYLAEVHSDLKIIYVFDKFGKKDEFLRERFVISTDEFVKLEVGKEHKIRRIGNPNPWVRK